MGKKLKRDYYTINLGNRIILLRQGEGGLVITKEDAILLDKTITCWRQALEGTGGKEKA